MKNAGILAALLIIVSIIFTACSNTASPTISPPPTTKTPTQQAPTQETTPTPAPTPQPTSTPTTSEIPIPTPKFATPDTGAIVGQIVYPDGSPAYRVKVYIWVESANISYAGRLTDKNGYYIFDDLPQQRYEVTATGIDQMSLLSVAYSLGTVTVSEKQTQRIKTKELIGDIDISYDNPKTGRVITDWLYSTIINGRNPKITWDKVQNADYYIVKIMLSHSKHIYSETENVTNNMIIWPTDLSEISQPDWDSEHHDAHEFLIMVEAFTKSKNMLAGGRDLFIAESSQ